MNKLISSIIQIDDINQINEEYKTNSIINKSNIIINFDESSIGVLNNFMSEHSDLKLIYLENNYVINLDLVEYDFPIYLFFIDCVEKAHDLILNSEFKKLELFENINLWNFSIVQNVMFNLPFTLSDIIYIPVQYIKDNWIKKDYSSLIRTIIHEKIHIGQRINKTIWSNYIYNNDKNWIKINNFDEIFMIVDNNIKSNNNLINTNEKFIANPDTFYQDFKYLYKINDKLYYGHYVFNLNEKNIYIKYFELDFDNKKLLKTNKIFNQEHPYETYAYLISEKMI